MILANLFCASTTTGISRSTTSTSPLTTSFGASTATLLEVGTSTATALLDVSGLGGDGVGGGSFLGISTSGLTSSIAEDMYWQQRCSEFCLQLTTSLWQILGLALDLIFWICFFRTGFLAVPGLNSGLPFFRLARLAEGLSFPFLSFSFSSLVSSSDFFGLTLGYGNFSYGVLKRGKKNW